MKGRPVRGGGRRKTFRSSDLEPGDRVMVNDGWNNAQPGIYIKREGKHAIVELFNHEQIKVRYEWATYLPNKRTILKRAQEVRDMPASKRLELGLAINFACVRTYPDEYYIEGGLAPPSDHEENLRKRAERYRRKVQGVLRGVQDAS